MYPLLRQLLFLRDPEDAHNRAISLLENLGPSAVGRALLRYMGGHCPGDPVRAMGLDFVHPVGMAAGFDKNARAVLGLQELGFSSVEVGTVTPRPQPGNVLPRLWRFPESEALVNSLGFPGEGMLDVRRRLQTIRDGGQVRIPIGVNLGKNSVTPAEAAVEDYLKVLDGLYDVGDFFVVNVSSPNTPGLRDLQAIQYLSPILETLANRAQQRGGKPLLVKIAPDLADADVVAIGRLARELNLAGIVAANTTIRRSLVPGAEALDRGGLSGAPLLPRTHELIKLLRKELAPEQTLIACGGICSPERLRQTLALGANLAQIYTAFIYLGPRCVRQLSRNLPR
jgi:dihydroorotate dehydrogenase